MDVSLYRIKLMAGLGEHLCSTLKIPSRRLEVKGR